MDLDKITAMDDNWAAMTCVADVVVYRERPTISKFCLWLWLVLADLCDGGLEPLFSAVAQIVVKFTTL